VSWTGSVITIKSDQAQARMRQAGKVLSQLFVVIKDQVVAGVTTGAIDAFIAEYLNRNNLVSQSKGYHGYRHVSCISVNDEVVHGVPSQNRLIQEGDLVKIDVCAALQGYCADMARCYVVGEPSERVASLIAAAERSLFAGIEKAVPGNRIGDISSAIQGIVEQAGFGVVRDFAGHGIGSRMHEDPEILNYGSPKTGPLIKPGMAFAIEPMITEGSYQVYVDTDGWTVKTVDRRLAAHIEDTVIITEHGPEVITRGV